MLGGLNSVDVQETDSRINNSQDNSEIQLSCRLYNVLSFSTKEKYKKFIKEVEVFRKYFKNTIKTFCNRIFI